MSPSRKKALPPEFADAEQVRVERVRSDIAGRLQKACSNLSEAEFAALVEKMTSVKLGGDRYRPSDKHSGTD